jgi:hypothetical protein
MKKMIEFSKKKFKDVKVGDTLYVLDMGDYSYLKNIIIFKIQPIRKKGLYGFKEYHYEMLDTFFLHAPHFKCYVSPKGQIDVFFKDRKYDYVSSRGFLFFTENEGRENYMKQFPQQQ